MHTARYQNFRLSRMTFTNFTAGACLLFAIELCRVMCINKEVIVKTKYGQIRGTNRHFSGINKPIRTVNLFLGIPFASPPTGKLRFRPPQKHSGWEPSIYDATNFRSICIQDPEYYSFFWPGLSLSQSEDCLYLNVYSPSLEVGSKELFPVMVYIHGGGYEAGTPAINPGDLIPLWGVVLVTIQYRVGPFGFVTTGDSVAPGNYGMMDQIEAMKWVQENIVNFGGNASKVTIFGESAGGSSVGLMLLSEQSNGLFHRAISISGVDLSPFAIGSSTEVKKQTRKVAKEVGCLLTGSKRKMIDCMRSADALKFPVNEANIWRPIVDGNFLLDTPRNLRNAGKFHDIPYMAGFTSREGSYFFSNVINKVTPENFRRNTKDIFNTIGNQYGQKLVESQELLNTLLDTIILLYTPWPNKLDPLKIKQGIPDAIGDFTMTAPTHEDLVLHSKKAPVYMYEFAHRSSLNPSPSWKGATHKDDTPYQFGFPLMNLTVLQQYDEVDRNVSDMVITLFTNFAKYGNPTSQPVLGVKWEGFNSSHRAYLRIHPTPEMAINFKPTRVAFWNEYYENMLREGPNACRSRSSACTRYLSLLCSIACLLFYFAGTFYSEKCSFS